MSQLKLKGGTSGDVTIKCVDQAGTTTATFTATTGNVVTTGDTDTVTSAMLTDNIDIAGTLDVTGKAVFDNHVVIGGGEMTDAALTIGEANDVALGFARTGTGGGGQFDGAIELNSDGHFAFRSGANSSTVANLTERMRILNDGRVLIGQTDFTGINTAADNLVVSANHPTGITIHSSDGGNCNLYFGDDGDDDVGYIRYNHSANRMEFRTDGADAMRIHNDQRILFTSNETSQDAFTSSLNAYEFRLNTGFHSNVGTLMVRAEDQLNADGDQVRIVVTDNNRSAVIGVAKTASDKAGFINLVRDTGQNAAMWFAGSNIARVSSNTANVGNETGGVAIGDQTSDSRVKNSITDYTGGLSLVTQLRPVNFKYNEGGDQVHAGFIAQEVQSIIPESVYDTGDHLPVIDADGKVVERKPVDENGVEIEDAEVEVQYQTDEPSILAMSYVEIIPALVNSIKELKAEVDTLKTKVATLEAG